MTAGGAERSPESIHGCKKKKKLKSIIDEKKDKTTHPIPLLSSLFFNSVLHSDLLPILYLKSDLILCSTPILFDVQHHPNGYCNLEHGRINNWRHRLD